MKKIGYKSWKDLKWWGSLYWEGISEELRTTESGRDYLPYRQDIFRPLFLTPLKTVKVVILGDEPYYHRGQPDGLAFSTRQRKVPPALRNIFIEYKDNLNTSRPTCNDLSPWAKQGILLINVTWTVSPAIPKSHVSFGWDNLTKEVCSEVHSVNPDAVFVCWGDRGYDLLSTLEHFSTMNILRSTHPESCQKNDTFFGSAPFSRINNRLMLSNQKTINWRLP